MSARSRPLPNPRKPLACLVLLLALLVAPLAPPLLGVATHPPDAHSPVPHYASSTLVTDRAATLGAVAPSPDVARRLVVVGESVRPHGRVDGDAPDHPPR